MQVLWGYDQIQEIRIVKKINYYKNISEHYTYSSSLGNKATQEICVLDIPSIFYGKSIRKGSISCKWYVTGTLIAELSDYKKNGEAKRFTIHHERFGLQHEEDGYNKESYDD